MKWFTRGFWLIIGIWLAIELCSIVDGIVYVLAQ